MGTKFRYLVLSLTAMNVGASTPVSVDDAGALLQGTYDNHAQVEKAPADHAVPHVVVTIQPTAQHEWSLWQMHVQLDGDAFDQTWAMQTRAERDGSGALIPYYQFKQLASPSAATFDPQQWLSLEACALRGPFTRVRIEGFSEGEPCVAVTMGVGARRALLPVGILREGDRLRVDLNLRGERGRIDAERMPRS
jgi:hypothetical protein